jgi:3-hydroxyacyl-CoA dehydrogenase
MLYGHIPQVIGIIGAGQMGSGIAQVRAYDTVRLLSCKVELMSLMDACETTHGRGNTC